MLKIKVDHKIGAKVLHITWHPFIVMGYEYIDGWNIRYAVLDDKWDQKYCYWCELKPSKETTIGFKY